MEIVLGRQQTGLYNKNSEYYLFEKTFSFELDCVDVVDHG